MGVVAAAVQVDHCSDRPFFKFNCMICTEYAHVEIFFCKIAIKYKEKRSDQTEIIHEQER